MSEPTTMEYRTKGGGSKNYKHAESVQLLLLLVDSYTLSNKKQIYLTPYMCNEQIFDGLLFT